ncbi:hypothetical protein CBR_g20117 [Chara braunii]|uniref:YEATS domain-containing protein n=1 Tax=Chara braunii TaxID=69332 RepID=A0A388KZK5_CHABU|nr:hypothetical protein CBR_g20117 [Chara braunii]|eukprot:GBG75486.1 hypothetical protein CBR_g20117 [Chara braunii]
MKDVEVTVPIAYGTISFWLGKKADEYHSHKWTVYVRAVNNEDLSAIIKKVVFQLHPSFSNPTRVVENPPFELNETGWGEFEIGISIYFHPDISDKPIDIFHPLRLYPEEEGSQPSTKKPVVVESYDELVFTEPSEGFLQRILNNPCVQISYGPTAQPIAPPADGSGTNPSSGDGMPSLTAHPEKKDGSTKNHNLAQYFLQHSDEEELAALREARRQVAASITKLERDLAALESEANSLRAQPMS